ncbi:hypothetical protein ACHAWF_014047 [Thalassiosira exigua]
MVSDIDVIWNSLKNEEATSSSQIAIGTSEEAPSQIAFGASKKPAKPKREVASIITRIGQPFDIDAVSADDLAGKPLKCNSTTPDCGSQVLRSEDLFIVCDSNSEIDGAYVRAFDGDSDDEDEEVVKENVPPQEEVPSTSWRIERVAKALKSDDALSRTETLAKLKVTIDALLASDCLVAPPLNYPPPYDDRNIKLNQNLPLVSDLVKPQLLLGEGSGHPHMAEEPGVLEESKPRKLELDSKRQLQTILSVCGNSLFRLIGDVSEKCRELSLECLQSLLLAGLDFSRHIPYMIPALCARFAPVIYDKDLEVFVEDMDTHELYKRGGATNRLDRDGLLSHGGTFVVIEPNEELRLELCRTLNCLLRGVSAVGAQRALDAYYADIILLLQTCLRDPFPELKVEACRLLVQLLRIPHMVQGAKYFATGLARSALPNCRHRNTNVIIASMDLLEASVCVPDRAKVKGAGTAAIADLVGFREENVLPVAAFYDSRCGVSVNTLAELASHKNHRVRLRCCHMLSYWLVYLPDRYDHQQRLMPYILSFIHDHMANVQNEALHCLEKCGSQYESEHPDDVVERRQFGVDGDETVDYGSDLPPPFDGRPSLGARLFVRANCGRFFLAMLDELSSWRDQTRARSAELLLILAVYCEEHLTKDFQHTLNSIAKAIGVEKSSRGGSDQLETLEKLEKVLRLTAKFVDPEAYLPLIVPRILGDNDSATSNSEEGSHSEQSRSSYMTVLRSLIEGAPARSLVQHFADLAALLSSAGCIGPFAGTRAKSESLKAFLGLISRINSCEDDGQFAAYFDTEGEKVEFQSILKSAIGSVRGFGGDAKVVADCIIGLSKLSSISLS